MERDSGIEDGREPTGGIGPPGSLSRRRLLQGAAAAGLTLGATQLDAAGATAATRRLRSGRGARPRRGSISRRLTPPVNGLHLQFGADASQEVVVSWQTYAPVAAPQVFLGTLESGLHRSPALPIEGTLRERAPWRPRSVPASLAPASVRPVCEVRCKREEEVARRRASRLARSQKAIGSLHSSNTVARAYPLTPRRCPNPEH